MRKATTQRRTTVATANERMSPLIATLNAVNNLVHIEPIAIVIDLVYWAVVFLVGFPLAAVVALLRGLYLFVNFFVGQSDLDPTANKKKQEFAVFITGCDSGFGKELVQPLTARGFTVFAGCLHKESFGSFQKDSLVIPIQVDVTSDRSVTGAFKIVSSWLAGGGKKKRYFHALVNNAGVGRPSMIDWASLSDFQACIDVNYLGLVRCVKEFLPLFQKQAAAGTYSDARIVNMVSMAGLFSGGDGATSYVASKHAADAFTTNLRLEMSAYGVHVTTVNPTFHQTPMACPDLMEVQLNNVWSNLKEKQRKEYGEGTFWWWR